MGNIDIGMLGSKNNIVQAMNRISYFDDLSHLRRITDPADNVAISRRRLHGTQYGCVCPVETPEGANIGLRKALSMMSQVSFGCKPDGLIELIKANNLLELEDLKPDEIYKQTKVFVNGIWIGIHSQPEVLIDILRTYRRCG